MGMLLIAVFVFTAYGTDLLLKRILHTTHEEAALLRKIDDLAAEVRARRACQDSVDREVALLCAAADADAAEFRKLCEDVLQADGQLGPDCPANCKAPESTSAVNAANGKTPASEAGKKINGEGAAESSIAADGLAPVPDIRVAYMNAQSARRSQIRLGVAAGLAGGMLLGSLLDCI
ncbi:hypothetical protein CC85DRAFT_311567 [Cutaneotrichosporon oleaginosum]|uniref:Uncharacterized protein n=1 Tax=Cutaneotrichosporon oleaginosum TaxID=879819 RepID=A0A0J0XRS0_9TREE|nr:uncharacterized protein CC85DRAFT_311567 [Cutaneotrichosporon oleaginosum]KLT43787.1 hypothetical protein CC85DRAFT_311567 [Cutaneotrichosporon oleaginosum]TXT05202.1 hypothetical protein COLE_06522 [Cutaneotrichosporon oleaginosum]